MLAAGAQYLDLAVESALQSASLRHLVVFDYQPRIDDHQENLERARRRLHDACMPVVVSTLDEVIQRGRQLPPEPFYTGGTDERLAIDPLHVGQHRDTQGRDVHRTDAGQPMVDVDRG